MQKEIIENIKEKQSTVNYNILALSRASVIRMEKKGRNKQCYLTNGYYRTLQEELMEEEPQKPKTKKCQYCNADVLIDFAFCNMCGKKFE